MTAQEQPELMPAPSVFGRVIAGADGTDAGFEAVRQAVRLVEPDGWLEVFTAVNPAEAAMAGWSGPRIAEQLERDADETIRKAVEIAGERAESHLVHGPPLPALMHELTAKRATLAVVGSHGHGRLTELMLGGVVGELLHRAPCSVLVARPPTVAPSFPRAIVVGIDGSPQADAAIAAARSLARRFDARLRFVCALRGKDIDAAHVALTAPVELLDEEPVAALVAAARDADLLVVGSRGLHGIRALGSVSERVAHHASCSVLVVHGPG